MKFELDEEEMSAKTFAEKCIKCGALAQPDTDPPMCTDCMAQKGGGNDPETAKEE